MFPRPLICVVLGVDGRQNWSSPLACSFTVSSSSLCSLAVVLSLLVRARHLLFRQHLRLSDVAHYIYFYNVSVYPSVSITRSDCHSRNLIRKCGKGCHFFLQICQTHLSSLLVFLSDIPKMFTASFTQYVVNILVANLLLPGIYLLRVALLSDH